MNQKLVFEGFDNGFLCHYNIGRKNEVAFITREKMLEALSRNISFESGILPLGTINISVKNNERYYYILQREHFEEKIVYVKNDTQRTEMKFENVFMPNLIWKIPENCSLKKYVRAIGNETFGANLKKWEEYRLKYVPFSNVDKSSAQICFGNRLRYTNPGVVPILFFKLKFNKDLNSGWGCMKYLEFAQKATSKKIREIYERLGSTGETLKDFLNG